MTLETQELRAVLPGVGLTQCCSTGLTARAEGKRAQGYLCHFLVPSCGCPPTREVTEVKKKKNYFFRHLVVMLRLLLHQPQLLVFFPALCSCHPVHCAPACVTLTAQTLSPTVCAVWGSAPAWGPSLPVGWMWQTSHGASVS